MHAEGYGYCQCGCGEKTKLSPQTVRKLGYVKGEPRPYVLNHDKRGKGPEYIVDPDTGCWVWQRYVSKKGYGQMRPHGSSRMHPAHRVYYERAKGPVPDGLELDHLCHTNDLDCPGGSACLHRRCVNPDHLEVVTREENLGRGRASGAKPGRPRPELRKTHCKHGHEFTPENTIIGSDGARRCRECQKAIMRRYYHYRRLKKS